MFESGLPELASPESHAAALAEKLRPHTHQIREALTREKVTGATVRIVEHTYFDNPEAYLGPEVLDVIAATGASLVFDVYLYPDSEDEEVEETAST